MPRYATEMEKNIPPPTKLAGILTAIESVFFCLLSVKSQSEMAGVTGGVVTGVSVPMSQPVRELGQPVGL